MSCSHAAGCPLFPLLRASLQGWRDYYCDSEDQWLGCARYQVSLTGERVPISLLPNGARARHLEEMDESADGGGAAGPARVPRQGGPPRHGPRPQVSAYGSPPAPAWPVEPVTAEPEAPARFGPASPTISASAHRPSTSERDRPPRRDGQGSRAKRGVWARLAEWMGGPA